MACGLRPTLASGLIRSSNVAALRLPLVSLFRGDREWGLLFANHITRRRLELGATCPKIIGLTSSLVKSPIGALDT